MKLVNILHRLRLVDISSHEEDLYIDVCVYLLSLNPIFSKMLFPERYGFDELEELKFEYDSIHHPLKVVTAMFDYIHVGNCCMINPLTSIEHIKLLFLLRTYASIDIYIKYKNEYKFNIKEDTEEPDYNDELSVTMFLLSYSQIKPSKENIDRCIEKGLFDEMEYRICVLSEPAKYGSFKENMILVNRFLIIEKINLELLSELYGNYENTSIYFDEDTSYKRDDVCYKLVSEIGHQSTIDKILDSIEDFKEYLSSIGYENISSFICKYCLNNN